MNEHNYTRRDFLKNAGLGAIAMAISGCITSKANDKALDKKPNIVFILADDLGYGCLGCYGATKIRTPNCDRLAKQGRLFTNAHDPASVCSPTRFGVITGGYPWRGGRVPKHMIAKDPLVIRDGEYTIPGLLKQNGYATAAFGKWHLGVQRQDPVDWNKPLRPGPNAIGFDEYYGAVTSHNLPPFLWVEDDHIVGKKPTDNLVIKGDEQLTMLDMRRDDTAIGTTLVKKAIDFLERKKNQPFFLYYPTCAVHYPFTPATFMRGKSQAGIYGDFVQEFDWQVGQIMETLDRLGLADNTLLIVTSDNGAKIGWTSKYGFMPNGSLRGEKGTIYEGGHRIPFIARWPGKIPADTVSDEVISLVDLMATACAVCDIDMPASAGPDTFNILPALLGDKHEKPVRDAIVCASQYAAFLSIQQGPWKLIVPRKLDKASDMLGPRQMELYNLEDDPSEQKNLYDAQPDVASRLKALLDRFEQQGYSRKGYKGI